MSSIFPDAPTPRPSSQPTATHPPAPSKRRFRRWQRKELRRRSPNPAKRALGFVDRAMEGNLSNTEFGWLFAAILVFAAGCLYGTHYFKHQRVAPESADGAVAIARPNVSVRFEQVGCTTTLVITNQDSEGVETVYFSRPIVVPSVATPNGTALSISPSRQVEINISMVRDLMVNYIGGPTRYVDQAPWCPERAQPVALQPVPAEEVLPGAYDVGPAIGPADPTTTAPYISTGTNTNGP